MHNSNEYGQPFECISCPSAKNCPLGNNNPGYCGGGFFLPKPVPATIQYPNSKTEINIILDTPESISWIKTLISSHGVNKRPIPIVQRYSSHVVLIRSGKYTEKTSLNLNNLKLTVEDWMAAFSEALDKKTFRINVNKENPDLSIVYSREIMINEQRFEVKLEKIKESGNYGLGHITPIGQ